MNIITRAEKISDDMISRRRRLHRIPEVGLHLPQTAGVACEFLNELKIPFQTFENHSGIVPVIGEEDLTKRF